MKALAFLLLAFFYGSLLIPVSAQKPSNGGMLKPEQANMDILHYAITISVNIPDKSIAGHTVIRCLVKAPADVLLFDLMDSFKVQRVLVNGKPALFSHKDHLLRISSSGQWARGLATVRIDYAGRPMTAKRPPWDDGFTFAKDSTGHPWVAVTAESTGGKVWFPCKDHPSDKPDEGAELFITVPRGLLVAGPGLLQKVIQGSHTSTFCWKTIYPLNNYSIVFTAGDYTVVNRQYTTVAGHSVPMQFFVLAGDVSKAPHLLEMMERVAHVKEKYLGEYPWVKEKIGLVEAPYLGMEHQTMNAYGNGFRYTKKGGEDYDWLMNHEFGHEWFGNKMTAGDWADFWIQEGLGTFGDALYTKEMEGEASYESLFRNYLGKMHNEKPVIQGKDLSEEEAYNGDIYYKGGFFVHTLRYMMGDSIFFPVLKQLLSDTNMTGIHTIRTEDIQRRFSKAAGTDLSPLFHLYLYTTQKLEVHVRQVDTARYLIQLDNLDMALPLDISTDRGTSRMMIGRKGTMINSASLPLIDQKTFYLKKVIYE